MGYFNQLWSTILKGESDERIELFYYHFNQGKSPKTNPFGIIL